MGFTDKEFETPAGTTAVSDSDAHDSHCVSLGDTTIESAAEGLESACFMFSFLAAAYREELSIDFLERLRDSRPVVEGQLASFIASLGGRDLEQVRIDLAAEYARLFLGMSAVPAAPYESVYTSEGGLLMQDAYFAVIEEYAAIGFKKAEEFKLPADHIALELEFVAILAQVGLEALNAGKMDEYRDATARMDSFIKSHLCNWVYRFGIDLEKLATSDFYLGLAELTREVLLFEEERLSSL